MPSKRKPEEAHVVKQLSPWLRGGGQVSALAVAVYLLWEGFSDLRDRLVRLEARVDRIAEMVGVTAEADVPPPTTTAVVAP